MSLKDPRLPRVERARAIHLDDETSHLWAVSYADFLMVLLSFFIIFFSLDKKTKDSVIDEIMLYSSGQEGVGGGVAAGREPTSQPGKGIAAVALSLKDFNFERAQDERALFIHMPDDIYEKGSARFKKQAAEQFRRLIGALKQFDGRVKITFVGHTDQTPLVRKNYPGVTDNFDLSALRASSALRLAMQEGFDPRGLFMEGAAQNQRNSRTLSILIEEEKVK